MNNWLKTFFALTAAGALRLIQSPAIVVMVAIILLGPMTHAQSAPGIQELPANELARRVVTNELKFRAKNHTPWAYRQEKEEAGKKQVKRIIETKDGVLSRLLSINDRPLTAKEQAKERQRIQELVSNPVEQRKLQAGRDTQTGQVRRLFEMLPDAFVFSYAGRDGGLIRLNFRPNPVFHRPPWRPVFFTTWKASSGSSRNKKDWRRSTAILSKM